MRLALVYALLDCDGEIDAAHLEAALAVWRYCEQSAVHLFGASLGDPVADEILRALKASGGPDPTEIRDLFAGRTRARAAISAALTALLAQGLARFTTEATGGRPVERWTATTPQGATT